MLIRHILLPLLLGLIIYPLVEHESSRKKQSGRRKEEQELGFDTFTSGVCTGSNASNRRCHFKNLFLDPIHSDFVFVHDKYRSVRSGIPVDRGPSLVDTSSVSNHTSYSFNFVDVSSDRYEEFLCLQEDENSENENGENENSENEVLDEEKSCRTIHRVEGHTLVIGRFKPDNLMHLVHDEILPLLATIEEVSLDHGIDRILFVDGWEDVPGNEGSRSRSRSRSRFMWEMYEGVFPSIQLIHMKRLLSESPRSVFLFHHLHVGLVKDTLWYDYGFFSPPHPLPRSVESDIRTRNLVRLMNQRLRGGIDISNRRGGVDISNRRDSIDISSGCESNPVIIISRKETRLIMNEEDLSRSLQEKGHSVEMIDLSDYQSIIQVIRKINCAKVLLGVHGAALVLTAFLPRQSSLVEIFPFAIPSEKYSIYKTLATILNVNYFTWTNHDRGKSFAHADYPPHLGGIQHLTEQEQASIIESNTVRDHLCCSDPNWLYRIHQDTIVDVDTIVDLVSKSTSRLVQSNDGTYDEDNFLSLGSVRSIKCSKDHGRKVIEWKKPWNADLIIPTNLVNDKNNLVNGRNNLVNDKNSLVNDKNSLVNENLIKSSNLNTPLQLVYHVIVRSEKDNKVIKVIKTTSPRVTFKLAEDSNILVQQKISCE